MKFYSSVQIEKNEMGLSCSRYVGEKGCTQGLVGKPERKRPLEKPWPKWEVNITIDHQDVGWVTWIGLIWPRTGIGGGHL